MRNTSLSVTENKSYYELEQLCILVRSLILEEDFDSCFEPICKAMGRFPDAPHPHNLLGILWEKKGEHSKAMKHFRAASALDPTYLPVRQNLETYGTFRSHGRCAFDESDIQPVLSAYKVLFLMNVI